MTGISWADETWNPVVGCTPVSTGCAHCYAARTALRLDRCGLPQYRDLAQLDLIGRPAWSGTVRSLPDALSIPYRWGEPRVVFVGSMSDIFHEQVPGAFLDRIWDVMEQTDHVYLVLTKRPMRMRDQVRKRAERGGRTGNIWVGTSIESASAACMSRLGALVEMRPWAHRTFLSLEPLLEPLARPLKAAAGKFRRDRGLDGGIWGGCDGFVDWIIAGGESGPGTRPMQAEWARELRDLCRRLDIPFHFKQWGPPGRGRSLDGRIWDACPPRTEAADISRVVGRPWSGPTHDLTDVDRCITCREMPVFRHSRCRGCLGRIRRVLGTTS